MGGVGFGRPPSSAEHLDAYSIGEGELQRSTTDDARRFDGLIEGPFVEFGDLLDPQGEIELRVAGLSLPVHGTLDAVERLASRLDEVWKDGRAKG